MGSNSFDYEEASGKKKSGCKTWHVAIICSLLIAIGLAVGLGVGLSNQPAEVIKEPSPTTPKKEDTTPSVTTAAPITTSFPDVENPPWENYRLPTYIIPFHYDLMLHPNMSTDTYTGMNGMSFNVTQKTKFVLVHVDANLIITSSSLRQVLSEENTPIKIAREFRYPEWEYYVIEAEEELLPNSINDYYLLTLEFEGSLVGKIVGLYKSEYTVPDTGELKAMVGSDMEPTDARKAYPCFDEPALKIRYTTTLVHEPIHNALSNMPVKANKTRTDGLIETLFETSVPMSTYLGCFAISDFVYIEEKSAKNQIPLRVYVPPHQLAAGQAQYALEQMKIQFDYFEDLFGMDYSLPKCDMISIPNFGTGAMENWGLITYRETNLLWDPMESSTNNKQRVSAVIAHELVHQWFGNIVTMKWWDNIWLNEGFASYFEYYGVNKSEDSGWQIFDQFVIHDLQQVMRSDQSVTSHAIVVPVESPGQITSVFDTISYSKGAAVLRYMEDVLGREVFIESIKHYLKNRAFSNADEKDFLADIQEYLDDNSISIDITEVMGPWLYQMGFPVINVNTSSSPLTANQEYFLTDPNEDESQYGYKWNVDVTYILENDSTIQRLSWNNENDPTLTVSADLTTSDWIKFNPGQTGYYRVDYDDSMWESITNQLDFDHEAFTEIDRSNIMDDGLNLAPAKRLTYPQALGLTRYLDKETSYFVWDAFSSGSSYIRLMLQTTPIYEDFKAYYLPKVKPIADDLGWNASSGTHVDKRNRELVLALALRYGDEDALNNATSLFKDWINNATTYLYPDTRQLVYRYGVVDATVEQWEEMLARYVKEPVASEKSNLLRGLTSTESVELLSRMLEYSKNESIIKSQDFFNCITYISYSNVGNEMAWTWVQINWEYMVDRFTINDRNLGRLVPNIVSDYNTELKLWEVRTFFDRYPEAGAGASGRISAINSIETNIQWMKDNQETIANWFTAELTP